MLLLQGAMAAARIGDGATVRDLLGGAEEAARGLDGDHNYYWSCFGPTNVLLHRAAAAVELGEGRVAVEVHDALDRDAFHALLPERRAHHYLDQARAHAMLGDIDLASEMLLEGDRLAPRRSAAGPSRGRCSATCCGAPAVRRRHPSRNSPNT